MKSYLDKFLLLAAFVVYGLCACAQTESYKRVHQGNKSFFSKQYDDSERRYLQVLKNHSANARALFNLGDIYLARNNHEEAKRYFKGAARSENNKVVKGMAYHNLGYIYQTSHDLDSAIVCYKEALRNNPHDDNARYNLALCQKLKKEGKNNSPQQQKQQQEQSSPQSKEQQKQKGKQEKETDNKGSNGKNEDISDESVQQLLDLSRRKEQETREKLNNVLPARRALRKNW